MLNERELLPGFLQRILGVGKGKIKVFTTLAFKEIAYSIKNKMRNTSTRVLQKKWNKLKRVRSASDQFDRLPDEILIAILSLLTLKEAAATSILSCRWRYLWMYTTGCWNFDFFEKTKLTVMEVRNAVYKLRYQAFKYINWIREVLKVHRGPYLDELRITTYLDATTAAQVDQLLCYASRKGVQKLELDFKNIFNFLFPYRYSFPSVENLAHSLQSGDNVLLRLQHHLRGVTLHHFRSFCCLRSLRLRYIDITEEVLESIFSNCLLLQCLSVEESYRLENLQVHGLHLQHLEIINCFYLKSLEISAANLESFIYSGPYIDVPFRSVPQKLLKLTIGGSFGKSFVFESSKHVIYFSRLETLTLNVSCAVYRFPSVFPEMINLKHLEVKVTGTGLHTLLAYIILIKASPFLSTFKMEYLEQPVMLRKALLGSYQYSGSMCEATRFVHQHLEEVELIGFLACAADLNIVSLLLENSVNLKRMVLQFTSRYFRYQRDSRMCIRSLRAKMPPGVELVIR